MGMYPAYKLRDVLDEYAFYFFALLNQGYRLRHEKNLMLATIASVPHMEEAARAKFIRDLEWAAKDPADILKSSTGETDTQELAKMLG